MRVEFSLPIKAFSINQYRYGHSPHKTKEAREYEEYVLELLSEQKMLRVVAEDWRNYGGTFEVELVCVYPASVFFNSKGNVSAKTFDVTNTEKILLDLILNKTMDVDDRFVTKLTSSKIPGKDYEIRVTLEHETKSDT